jgi:hypothetical protein
MSKHTPGPLSVNYLDGQFVVQDLDKTILAKIPNYGNPEEGVNARLFAAAPDMVECLE